MRPWLVLAICESGNCPPSVVEVLQVEPPLAEEM